MKFFLIVEYMDGYSENYSFLNEIDIIAYINHFFYKAIPRSCMIKKILIEQY